MRKPRLRWPVWRDWRRLSQVLCLVLFIVLAARTQVPQGFNQTLFDAGAQGRDLRLSSPVTLFFDLDPLTAVGTMLSARALKPGLALSLAVLLPVLLVGRFFCGFICPFGALHQLMTHWGSKARKRSANDRLNRPGPAQKIKYALLFGLGAAALLGSNQFGLLDPLAFLFRGLVVCVFPGLSFFSNTLMGWLSELPNQLTHLSRLGPFFFDHILGYEPRLTQGAFLVGALFLFILALNLWRPRFFCRNICPLGALLGLFSRYSLVHLTKDESLCTKCGLCRTACQGASGPHPEDAWLRHECHLCFNCQAVCPDGALKFRIQPGRTSPYPSPLPARDGPDLGRRAVLVSLAAGVSVVGLGRASLAAPGASLPNLIRPPGSLPEEGFLTKCVRCGLCMRACPTNVLQPALAEAGVEGFWTPVLNFSLGYCEYTCTLCSSVCPTGAIRLITGQEKVETPISIGSAFFDRGRCLPWSGQGPCLVCEEHCPVSPKAIYLIPMKVAVDPDRTRELMAPQVNLGRCIGCGICSHVCPVRGRAAVYVTSVGETRSPGNRILLPERRGAGEVDDEAE